MDRAAALEHSVRALVAALCDILNNYAKTPLPVDDLKLCYDNLRAQWNELREIRLSNRVGINDLYMPMERIFDMCTGIGLSVEGPSPMGPCPCGRRDGALPSDVWFDNKHDDSDDVDGEIRNLETCIREHTEAVGLALRPTGLHADLRGDLPFECRKLFAMYACFKNTADPAKHDVMGVADALVGLFELYVKYPPPPPVVMDINKHDDC